WSIRETIGHLQRIFKLRTCDDTVFSHRSRPCLLHQIHRCSGPCVGLVSEEDYARSVRHAAQFLEGDENDVVEDLNAKMNAASAAQRYEEAAEYRDQVRMLARITSEQAVESTRAGDVDIVVAIEREGTWCVTLAMVRAGRHLGDRSFFPQNASGSDACTVVEAFLTQHYATQVVPGRVVCDQIDDPPGMELLLASLAGRAVKFVSRPIGESRTWLDMARRNASLALGQRLSAQATQEARVAALQEFLGADAPLGRIECFDVSHTMGEATVASCVVYDRGAMQSSEYRRFNITGVEPGDDYGAMRQVLERRYRKLADGDGKVPDLILIDGGLGQVNAARAALADLGFHTLRLVGVSKGEERKPGLEQLIFADEESPRRLPPDHPALHLIQQI